VSPLEDRIRELCAQVLAAPDSASLSHLLTELKAAMSEHIHNMRLMAAKEIPRLFRSDINSAD
jgi:hypothetical protein